MSVPTRVAVDLRLARAEKHLVELEHAVQDYGETDPYSVVETREGKPKFWVYRLNCSTDPSEDIAVIAGDFMHNVRSALNYLMVGLVPSKRRASTQFPIFTGTDPFAPGGIGSLAFDSETQADRRAQWNTFTKGIHPDALALIEREQPYHQAWHDTPTYLEWLSAASNRDKHSSLLVFSAGVTDLRYEVRDLNNNEVILTGGPGSDLKFFKHGAEIHRSQTRVKVDIDCTTEVVVKAGQQIHIPAYEMRRLLEQVRHQIVHPLVPFLRR